MWIPSVSQSLPISEPSHILSVFERLRFELEKIPKSITVSKALNISSAFLRKKKELNRLHIVIVYRFLFDFLERNSNTRNSSI